MSFIPAARYLSDGGHVADEQVGSTVPRRQLGRYLHDLRVRAGLTARTAAKQLERSEPTLWRIENGRTATRSLDVEQMCRLYGADEQMTKALMSLAKQTRARGWWQAYGDVVPEWLDLFIGLEAAATRIDWFETELVPGLFQTEAYARELIRRAYPDDDEPEIDRRVQLRMGRQAILRRSIDPPLMRVALRETVLRCHVGGQEAMSAQLARLAKVSELPYVSLRIVPYTTGLYSGMLSGAFGILRFPANGNGEETEPPTVYTDLFAGALYLDQPHEVARYDRVFGEIWEASLEETASRELLRKSAEDT
jgi:transcriptional regulator with XRE-family HTH domain